MKYIKFLLVLVGLFVFSLSAMARPYKETDTSKWDREDKMGRLQEREKNAEYERQAKEWQSAITPGNGRRAATPKPLYTYTPGEEYNPVLYQIISGQPVTVFIWKSRANNRTDYDYKVVGAFDSWFTHARAYIGQRSREFADVMPILQRGAARIQISYVTGNVDLPTDAIGLNIFDTQREMQEYCERFNIAGCMFDYPNVKLIAMYKDDPEFQSTLEHELGHVFGLGDVPHSNRGSALMGYASSMQCDDVDGLINLIDLWNGCNSDRAQRGWESLCGDGVMYRCGKLNQPKHKSRK